MNHIVYIRIPAGCNINVIFMQYKHNTLVIPLQRNQLTNRKIMDELTDIYKRIEYLRNNGVKMKEIADRVFLSSPAVSARIAKLEKDGVLTGYQAQVAPLKLGQLVKAFINLDMDPKLKPEFYPYIQSCGNVVECNCVTGDYSMLIEVLFGTTQELDTFINHLQQFGRTRTQIVFSTPVEHRGLPVSEPEEEPAAET